MPARQPFTHRLHHSHPPVCFISFILGIIPFRHSSPTLQSRLTCYCHYFPVIMLIGLYPEYMCVQSEIPSGTLSDAGRPQYTFTHFYYVLYHWFSINKIKKQIFPFFTSRKVRLIKSISHLCQDTKRRETEELNTELKDLYKLDSRYIIIVIFAL